MGYRVRPQVNIGYLHFPKFTYRSDTSKKFIITQWSKPDNTEGDSAFLPENSLVDSTCIAVLDTNLRELCNILSSQSCTARLWMQYLCNIEIMKAFLAAERSSKQPGDTLACISGYASCLCCCTSYKLCQIWSSLLAADAEPAQYTHTWLHKQPGDALGWHVCNPRV